ncbi:hypothetical protein PPL_07416 [Heterostelium album PN500]|uniref:Uncharacterized protein n=1 Tax=Heterostelium pallidum (strain ATCC 26659 / Pp 5 / PN500) TaxID=670386 RepID=D3BFW5_HETP5|nr:hypothetical protein PPL_07416 [Heterostelium album PN500]EFA79725.1 hypothetical protein PPL_07416 [Heterostelium album PN500]|eukprot:XP_020431846.1 hypothetical protein PPL_07416 [Heterostelium album PN500]
MKFSLKLDFLVLIILLTIFIKLNNDYNNKPQEYQCLNENIDNKSIKNGFGRENSQFDFSTTDRTPKFQQHISRSASTSVSRYCSTNSSTTMTPTLNATFFLMISFSMCLLYLVLPTNILNNSNLKNNQI